VRRRTQRGSMTILGDLAQATSPWSPRSWAEVMRHANLAGKAEVAELRLGYRVPKQVMDFARPLLDRAAPAVEVPKSFRSTVDPVVRRCLVDSIPRTTHDLVVEHLNRGAVAVIAPSELHGDLAHDLEAFGEQVTLLVPEGAKGLEFDVVVVIEPATIAGRTLSGLRSLYICLTRATKELIVLHAKPLPPSLSAGRPITVPSTYPNLRNGDPWDNDAAYWLLDQDGGEAWTHLVLFECLRQQPNQRRRNPQRVKEAAQLAQRHGVIQERQAYGRRTIVRLYRTDREAPTYPGDEAERRQHRS
ncbi:MAG: ATP-binding domain-containing protein, partial [Ornithinimicrobium sp.]|uniref:ATP-binding domain-containing protein n=1 Tax=Ornithinimicrobium sp. TaxID=1977084 RepID=UPI003D9B9684